MANRFNVVPIRTGYEGCVVVRVVLRTQSGRTIVHASRLESSAVEALDLLATLGRKGQMEMCRLLLYPTNAQGRLAVSTRKLNAKWPLRGDSHTERF